MRNLSLHVLGGCALAVLTACATPLTHTSARTLDQGRTEVTASLGIGKAPRFPRTLIANPDYVPTLQGSVRHGVSDRVELGVAFGPAGLSGRAKFGLLRSASKDAGVNLSLEPAVSVLYYPWVSSMPLHGEATVGAHLGVLLFGHELSVAPRVGMQLASRYEKVWTPVAGGSVALAFRLGKGFVLTPEAGFVMSLGEDDPVFTSPSFGLGFTWGR